MRVVADTNIIVSAIFFAGKPQKFLQEWFRNKFDLVCSEEIYHEYIATIEKIAGKYQEEIKKEIIPVLRDKLIFVKNRFNNKYSRDPDDNKFINCARSADAYYIVTGDKDLLVLQKIDKIKIVTVSEFLKFIK